MEIEQKQAQTYCSAWTDETRRVVWYMISRARKTLQIELSPVVAKAFIILQYYFNNIKEECPYKMFTLMTAALFTSCKIENCYRSIEVVHNELLRLYKAFPSQNLHRILGADLAGKEIASIVKKAEIDLLDSINFNTDFELPFIHFEKWSGFIKSRFNNESFIKLCQTVIIDICLAICSKFYLQLPPEVAAAAAAKDCLAINGLDPQVLEETNKWLLDVQNRYGDALIELATNSIQFEKNNTRTASNQ